MGGLVHAVASEAMAAASWLRVRFLDAAAMAARGGFAQEVALERNLAHRAVLMMLERVRLAGHPLVEGATEVERWGRGGGGGGGEF